MPFLCPRVKKKCWNFFNHINKIKKKDTTKRQKCFGKKFECSANFNPYNKFIICPLNVVKLLSKANNSMNQDIKHLQENWRNLLKLNTQDDCHRTASQWNKYKTNQQQQQQLLEFNFTFNINYLFYLFKHRILIILNSPRVSRSAVLR